MALPNELILEVCKNLAKRDLKAYRLVSKLWSHHASEYLFGKIYISPRKEDIEVFNFITQHEQLRHCVKRLEYDGTRFSPTCLESTYRIHLLMQVSCHSEFYRTHLNRLDPRYTQFIKSCLESSSTTAILESSNHAFFLEDHREWRNRDEYQQTVLENGEFLQTLTRGLSRLDLLNSVEVCNEWNTYAFSDDWRKWSSTIITKDLLHSEPYFYGSPFGRVWGLSHPQPCSWTQSNSQTADLPTGCQEFQIITRALSHSQRRIRFFQISQLSVSTFDSDITGTLVNHSINTYSGLEDLDLCFYDYDGLTDRFVGLSGLQALLGSMCGLRRLYLALPCDEWGEKALFKCSQVFPFNSTQWMGLNKLCIRVLLTSARDLINLLNSKMPNLRELTFEEVELLEGRWEGIVEFLKTSMKLLSFPIHRYSGLRHLEEENFPDVSGDDEEMSVFCTDLERYVVSGGRHPCLCTDEDASASSKYFLDLDL